MKRILKISHSIYSVDTFSKRILLLGAPGVGKGSFASRAARSLEIPHLSTGNMIREEISLGSDLGVEFKKYTDIGELLPVELVVPLIVDQLSEFVAESKGCIVDGFPRTMQGAMSLSEAGFPLGGEHSVFFAVHLTHLSQEDDIIVEKIMHRSVCLCGKNYNDAHIVFKDGVHELPPITPEVDGVCDRCGAIDSLYRRTDDIDLEVVRRRLEVYKNETLPVINYLESLGILEHFVVQDGTKNMIPSFLELLYNF